MKAESIMMHKILNFIYNENISIVEEIFKGKVSGGMLFYLVSKVEYYRELYNDNTKAWLSFIGVLDGENSDILIDYILK